MLIFFMDQANSVELYPNEMEMTEDTEKTPVTIPGLLHKSQNIQISACSASTQRTMIESLKLFDREIGYLLMRDPNRMCNKTKSL